MSIYMSYQKQCQMWMVICITLKQNINKTSSLLQGNNCLLHRINNNS